MLKNKFRDEKHWHRTSILLSNGRTTCIYVARMAYRYRVTMNTCFTHYPLMTRNGMEAYQQGFKEEGNF